MNFYLNRYALRDKLITKKPATNLSLVVVIPCCNEPDLIKSLQSLYDCDKPVGNVEVIVVINASDKAEEQVLLQNKQTLEAAKIWRSSHQDKYDIYFIEENQLSQKDAGVGLARKIGMDEAVRRFELIDNPDGIIACFDADARCQPNYLVALEQHFKEQRKSPACAIHYEHPIEGEHFDQKIYDGITQYELHLRYYKNGLAFAKLPYAFHTIGSSMAVRNLAYQKQNGMNKRKAGEDFYFLQKLIPLGNFTELKTTKIIPSPRVSDRVPFGTGKAMQSWLDDDQTEMVSYNPQSYIDLKNFAVLVPELYKSDVELSNSVEQFLDTVGFNENLQKIRKNSRSATHFTEVFFKWFNAFKVLKYMHFARDNFYPDRLISEGANELLELMNETTCESIKDLLAKYRQIDLK